MSTLIEKSEGLAKKAVLLARVSSKEQEEGYSIDAQKHRLQNYCERRNLEIIKLFELTESSTSGNRTKFKEMLKFCAAQKQTIAIVTDKVDRLQRSFKEYAHIDALIQDGKIELHFNTEGYVIHKGSMSQERLMWTVGVVMAQSYTDNLRDNIKRSFDHKIRLGEFPSYAPIGYKNVRGVSSRGDIIVDDIRAPLIQKIFTEFATSAYTLSHIAEKAEEWGLRSKAKSGKPLSRSHIYQVLTNPFYYGIMKVKENLYPHRYPPLVDKSVFDKCQEVFRSWEKKPFKYGGKEFMFRGLLTCKSTGKTVSTITKKKTYANGSKGEWTYLQSWDKDCKPLYIREEVIEKQVFEILKSLAVPPDVFEEVKNCLYKMEESEQAFFKTQIEDLRKANTRIDSRMSALMELRLNNEIDAEDFNKKRAEYRDQQINNENLIASHRAGDDGFKDAMIFLMNLCKGAPDLFEGSTTEQKRKMLNHVFWNLSLDETTLCYSLKEPFSYIPELAKKEKWWEVVHKIGTSLLKRKELIEIVSLIKT